MVNAKVVNPIAKLRTESEVNMDEEKNTPTKESFGLDEYTNFEFERTLYFSKGGQKLTLRARVENYSPEKKRNCRSFFNTMYEELMQCFK